MTATIRMFEELEAAANAARHLSLDDKFEALGQTGHRPLDICRFVLLNSKPDRERINYVRIVGYFFDHLSRRDFEVIFEEAWNLGINPYSFLFAIRGGGIPLHIPRPFQVRRRLYLNYHRDPNSSSLPWIDTPIFIDSLPPGLVFPWGIEFFRCRSLTEIGPGLEAGGPIRIRHCWRLRSVPKWLKAHQGLEVADSPEIRTIQSGITVHGNLDLLRLPSLYRHGSDIQIDGTLRIRRCPELTRLKPGLTARHLDIQF